MADCCGVAWYVSCTLGSKSGLKQLREPWEKMEREGRLPNLNDEVKYKVYSIRSGKLGAAMSLVFTYNDETFISIGLCVKQDDQQSEIFLKSQVLDKGIAWKLKLHGELTTTGQNILRVLMETWGRFGDYNYLTNNCQDFAHSALKAFNLPTKSVSDRIYFVTGAGIVVGIAALVGAYFSKK